MLFDMNLAHIMLLRQFEDIIQRSELREKRFLEKYSPNLTDVKPLTEFLRMSENDESFEILNGDEIIEDKDQKKPTDPVIVH